MHTSCPQGGENPSHRPALHPSGLRANFQPKDGKP